MSSDNKEDKIDFIDYPLSLRFKMRGKRKLCHPVDDACNMSKEEIRDWISKEEKRKILNDIYSE